MEQVAQQKERERQEAETERNKQREEEKLPLPGGCRLGENVYSKVQVVADGVTLSKGTRGRVIGRGEQGDQVTVQFDGGELCHTVLPCDLSLIPGGYEMGDTVFCLRDQRG